MTEGQLFGEKAILQAAHRRTADCIAKNDVQMVRFRVQMASFVETSALYKMLASICKHTGSTSGSTEAKKVAGLFDVACNGMFFIVPYILTFRC